MFVVCVAVLWREVHCPRFGFQDMSVEELETAFAEHQIHLSDKRLIKQCKASCAAGHWLLVMWD